MADQQYHELLFAYSLGCLDKEELQELNEYFQTENDFPWQELGEYQNLVALLPAILNVETPGPELKDKVARKLYRIKNERRPKKTSENYVSEHPSREIKPDISTEEKTEQSGFFEHSRGIEENEEPEAGETIKNDQKEEILPTGISHDAVDNQGQPQIQENYGENDFSHADEIDTMGIEINEVPVRQEPVPVKEEKKNYHLHGVSEPPVEKKGKSGLILTIILFVIILAGAFYLYQLFSLNAAAYKTRINGLDKQVSSLSEEVAAGKEVQRILQMKDTRIVNLFSASIKDGYGKVIISFQSGSGFLQLTNMPELSNEKSYRLWMLNQGKAVSLGSFKQTTNKSYYPFVLPGQNFKGEIRFLVTEESSDSTARPSNKVDLSGILQ
jgi:anti-sigma-K factor RskA